MSNRRPPNPVLRMLVGIALLSQAGCMSALTNIGVREALREAVATLAEASAADDVVAAVRDADVSASLATDEAVSLTDMAAEPGPTLSLDEAVDRAVARLKAAGELDAATQATLLSILDTTDPADWPAAIDAFTTSLERQRPSPPPAVVAAPSAQSPEISTVDDALVFPASTAVPLPSQAAAEPTPDTGSEPTLSLVPAHPEPAKVAVVAAARPVVAEPPVSEMTPLAASLARAVIGAEEPVVAERPAAAPVAPIIEPVAALQAEQPAIAPTQFVPLPDVSPIPTPTPLTVRNACFASRVRAWGVVDRFPEATFHPGQDVIVYFELDAPAGREVAAGHATSIDTLFRLVTADCRQLGQWDFEPIDDVSHAPRRDYFARYVLRIPDSAPSGPCRLEFVVTDLVSGVSTPAGLDCHVR